MAKTKKAMQQLDDLEKLLRGLQQTLPAQAATLAQATATAGVDLNVYNTAPGRVYRRTGETRRSIRAVTLGNGRVQVSARSKGARRVEFGTPKQWDHARVRINWVKGTVSGIPGMTRGASAPISIGRSGVKWRTPGPFIAPAAVTAGFFMRERVLAEVRQFSKSRSKRRGR